MLRSSLADPAERACGYELSTRRLGIGCIRGFTSSYYCVCFFFCSASSFSSSPASLLSHPSVLCSPSFIKWLVCLYVSPGVSFLLCLFRSCPLLGVIVPCLSCRAQKPNYEFSESRSLSNPNTDSGAPHIPPGHLRLDSDCFVNVPSFRPREGSAKSSS